jgi:hypothetical protein
MYYNITFKKLQYISTFGGNMARKNYSISIPDELEFDFDSLKEKIKLATDLAKINNKVTNGKRLPESVSELFIHAVTAECDKIIGKLEGKVSDKEMEKKEKHRKYLREYYREYRDNAKK